MEDKTEPPFELNIIMQIYDITSDSICPHMLPVERNWLLDSGASSNYIKCTSRYQLYEWLVHPIKIGIRKDPIWATACQDVELIV